MTRVGHNKTFFIVKELKIPLGIVRCNRRKGRGRIKRWDKWGLINGGWRLPRGRGLPRRQRGSRGNVGSFRARDHTSGGWLGCNAR
jgi:hypothetical protein